MGRDQRRDILSIFNDEHISAGTMEFYLAYRRHSFLIVGCDFLRSSSSTTSFCLDDA